MELAFDSFEYNHHRHDGETCVIIVIVITRFCLAMKLTIMKESTIKTGHTLEIYRNCWGHGESEIKRFCWPSVDDKNDDTATLRTLLLLLTTTVIMIIIIINIMCYFNANYWPTGHYKLTGHYTPTGHYTLTDHYKLSDVGCNKMMPPLRNEWPLISAPANR